MFRRDRTRSDSERLDRGTVRRLLKPSPGDSLARLPFTARLDAVRAMTGSPDEEANLAALLEEREFESTGTDRWPRGLSRAEVMWLYMATGCGMPDRGFALLLRRRRFLNNVTTHMRQKVILPLAFAWPMLLVCAFIGLGVRRLFDEIFGPDFPRELHRSRVLLPFFFFLVDLVIHHPVICTLVWVLLGLLLLWLNQLISANRELAIRILSWFFMSDEFDRRNNHFWLCHLAGSALSQGQTPADALRRAAGSVAHDGVRRTVLRAADAIAAGTPPELALTPTRGDSAIDMHVVTCFAFDGTPASAAALADLAEVYEPFGERRLVPLPGLPAFTPVLVLICWVVFIALAVCSLTEPAGGLGGGY